MAPNVALEVLDTVEQARRHLKSLEEVEKRFQEAKGQVEGFKEAVRLLVEELGLGEFSEVDESLAVKRLFSMLEHEEKRARQRESLSFRRESLRREIQKIESSLKAKEEELGGLLARYGVRDSEAFEQKLKDGHELERLRESHDKLLYGITIKTALHGLEEVREAFSSWSLPELETALTNLDIEHDSIEKELQAAHESLAKLEVEIKRLESSTQVEELLQEYHMLRARVKELSRKWALLKFEEYLLSKARERFEEENRPKVLEVASGYFSTITGGRYKMVLPSHDGKGFVVVDKDNRRISASKLSRGTTEQLYLSLRFGVMSICEPQEESIPVIMDDILVNFDPERMARAASGISQMAKERQVLFFTCHPDVAHLLASQEQGAKIIEMS
ncbi:MAG: hypothetical protein GXO58_05855, partial [Thermodesulfobacteria bacterium]|nr:hypothetical protein [Thermodesulfobacteriota bacterium]